MACPPPPRICFIGARASTPRLVSPRTVRHRQYHAICDGTPLARGCCHAEGGLLRQARQAGHCSSTGGFATERELGIDVGKVALDGAGAEAQLRGDFLIALALTGRMENLDFPGAELAPELLALMTSRSRPGKRGQLLQEARPCRVIAEDDVVAA